MSRVTYSSPPSAANRYVDRDGNLFVEMPGGGLWQLYRVERECWVCGEPYLFVAGEVRCPRCGVTLYGHESYAPVAGLLGRFGRAMARQLGVPLADDFGARVAEYRALTQVQVPIADVMGWMP